MAEQLGLFAPRRASAPAECPRVPGPPCRDGREGRCPGGARCEELGEQEAARIRTLEQLTPEELASPDLGVGPPDCACIETRRSSLLYPTPEEAAAAALSESCGACGSTTGAAFYERGPLAGLRRCWPCARPVLMTTMAGGDT